MSKVSTIARLERKTIFAMLVIACVVLLSACGGGSSSGSTDRPGGGTPPPPAPIEGVSTPTSVAVVTATNA